MRVVANILITIIVLVAFVFLSPFIAWDQFKKWRHR